MGFSDWDYGVKPPTDSDGNHKTNLVWGMGVWQVSADGTSITNIATGDTYDLTGIGSSSSYSDEDAQDAIGNIFDSSLNYSDSTPSMGIAAGGVGTQEISDLSVTTAKIAADAVTTAKLGSGAVTSTEISSGAVTNSEIAIGTITDTEISSDAITNTEVAIDAIDTAQLVDAAVDAARIASSAVSSGKIASDAITSAKIAADAVVKSAIASGAVDTTQVATDAITQTEIAASAVGTAQLIDEDVQDIVGGMVDAGLSYNDSGNSVSLDQSGGSGQVTLSSGKAVVNTGISATDATFMLALGINDPAADCKVTGRFFWDDSAGTYKIEIIEDGTSVGNPTVNYDIVRVR